MAYTPLEQKLQTALLADAGVAAIVGTNVFGVDLPQGILSGASPIRALTVLRVSTQRGSLQDRGIHTMAAIRIQFTGWCKGKDSEIDALALNNALTAFLNTFNGTTGSVTRPNTILNERITRYPNTLPPLYLGIVDARILNREDL